MQPATSAELTSSMLSRHERGPRRHTFARTTRADTPSLPHTSSREVDDFQHTLHTLERDKALQYEPHMARLRNVAVVRSGLRAVVYRTCSFTSLGALGSSMSKCINGAAGFLKQRELLADVPRADGLTPQRVAGRFRFLARCCIQAAIMSGNAAIARSVGL